MYNLDMTKTSSKSIDRDTPPRIDPERKLLSAPELARRLGISRAYAYSLMSSGGITTVRVGRLVRVSVDAVEAWIAARSRGENHAR